VVRVTGEPAHEFSSAAAAGDGEEQTIASARSPFDAPVETDASVEMEDALASGETIEIDELDDHSYLMEEPEETLADERREDLQDYSSSSVIVPAQQPAVEAPPPAVYPSPRPAPRPYTQVVEETSPSSASRLLSAVLFLLLGAVLGAGAYYLWLAPQAEQPAADVPVLTVQKSDNIPLTSFEETRRIVDKDPAGYINSRAASMREADDYFWMGRAFLLTGKYWEAKRSFLEARNRLATVDTNDAKTMANEISMALAIIESPQATESFTRDLATANAASNTATTNTNTATNANTPPIR
jgi:hypothetical protein